MNASFDPRVMMTVVEAELSRRAASASLYEFVKQAWHVVEPGVPFVPSWHIRIRANRRNRTTIGEHDTDSVSDISAVG